MIYIRYSQDECHDIAVFMESVADQSPQS